MASILHVITGLGLGGAERSLVEVAVGLQRCGFPQHVASLRGRGEFAAELRDAGVQVHTFDVASVRQGIPAVWRLGRLVQRLRPDAIQGWMYHGDLAAALAHRMAGGRSQRRLLWNIRASNVDAARYGRLVRMCGWFSRWPDVVVSNSEAGARFHCTHGYRPRRVMIIPNGVDTQRFRPDATARHSVRAEFGLGDGVVAIHVARVDPMKDHDMFLRAMADLPDVTGLLVGAGTENLAVSRNLRAAGARRDVERLYAAADLVVSSSAFGEGFSNALAEGMSTGLVPIATDVGDSTKIVGQAGCIVPPRDPRAFAEAIRAEAAATPERRQARGLDARARIVELFSSRRVIEDYARLYRDIDASQAHGPR